MVAAYHGHTEIVRAIFKHSIASVHMQDEVRVFHSICSFSIDLPVFITCCALHQLLQFNGFV